MGKIFYIGDWHYGHANIIAYDNRPFQSIGEMNEVLIQKWNSKVQDGDTVYVLGDMFWRPRDAADVMGRLKGSKVLIRGNHDSSPSDQFTQVASYLEVSDNGRLVVLCHYPVLGHRDMFRGAVHLYAHVHTGYDWHILEDTKSRLEALYERPMAMYNTGAMMPWMGYEPRTLDEIQTGYLAWKAKMDAMGPVSHPEIDRMLTLSTAHISEETAGLLDTEPETTSWSWPYTGRPAPRTARA